MNLNAPWTDDRIERLKALYAEGLTGSQIAKQLGGVTRNAVIGKCHRLGLTGRTYVYTPRPKPAKRAANTREADRRAALRLVSPDHAPEPKHAPQPVFAPSDAKGIPAAVHALQPDQCRYPIGETDDPDFHFCPHETDGQSPYCAEHRKKCHEPGREPKPRHSAAHGPVHFARAG